MANSVDPGQLASEANWSESTLFAKTGHMDLGSAKPGFTMRKMHIMENWNKGTSMQVELNLYRGICSKQNIYLFSLEATFKNFKSSPHFWKDLNTRES